MKQRAYYVLYTSGHFGEMTYCALTTQNLQFIFYVEPLPGWRDRGVL